MQCAGCGRHGADATIPNSRLDDSEAKHPIHVTPRLLELFRFRCMSDIESFPRRRIAGNRLQRVSPALSTCACLRTWDTGSIGDHRNSGTSSVWTLRAAAIPLHGFAARWFASLFAPTATTRIQQRAPKRAGRVTQKPHRL